MNLLELPDEVLEKILSNLTFDEIAKSRVVCRKFNVTCGQLLNRGFLNMERRHSAILKKVKSLLPRRESERRVHHLARHSDILTAIETRINMLRMTFMKHIDNNACYFIPGKIIDEILRILDLVKSTCTPPRAHDVLLELRDISSMAIEHFDEKIAPNLKLQHAPIFPAVSGTCLFNSLSSLLAKDTFRTDFAKVQRRTLAHKQQIYLLKNILTKVVLKIKKQNTILHAQRMKIRDQAAKLQEQDSCITELKRHVEDWDVKFTELVAEINKTKDETSLNTPSTSKTPTPNITSLQNSHSAPTRLYKSNIKPRMAQILPNDRKRKIPTEFQDSMPSKMFRLQYLTNKNEEQNDGNDIINSLSNRNNFADLPFLSSSLESILKSPISSIKSRKRKLQ